MTQIIPIRANSIRHDPMASVEAAISPGEMLNITDEKRLKTALEHANLYAAASDIFYIRPSLYSVCKKLAGYVTEHFPTTTPGGQERGLLITVLADAIQRYQLAQLRATDERLPAALFLQRLVLVGEDMVGWHVAGEDIHGERHLWPVMDISIAAWIRKKRIRQLVFRRHYAQPSEETVRHARTILGGRLVEWSDQELLEYPVMSPGQAR